MNESFKKVALEKMLVGKIMDHFERLNLSKFPFVELLVKVNEQARVKKVDKDVSKGKAGVAAGGQQLDDDQHKLWRSRGSHIDFSAAPLR